MIVFHSIAGMPRFEWPGGTIARTPAMNSGYKGCIMGRRLPRPTLLHHSQPLFRKYPPPKPDVIPLKQYRQKTYITPIPDILFVPPTITAPYPTCISVFLFLSGLHHDHS